MGTQRHYLVSHEHLLRLTSLTQKVVDYSVKAYEFNCSEFLAQALEVEKQLRAVELSIAHRGRSLLAAGKVMDSTSRAGCCSLRLYSALRITYAAASEIARNTCLKITKGRVSTSAATTEVAHLVNSLVRLSTVAVFNQQAQHAETVLQIEAERGNYDVWPGRLDDDLQEVAISRCLEQIAEQACEIANVVTRLYSDVHETSKPVTSAYEALV